MHRVLPIFTLVTGNRGKAVEVSRLLGFEPPCAAVDLPELQELDQHAVLKAKAATAWEQLKRPLVVDETGLFLDAMNGFPGPLVKWMLKAVGAAGVARAALAQGNAGAEARCGLLYKDEELEILVEGITRGRLVAPPRGDNGFGWDSIFMPEGFDQTYAELSDGEKDRIGHRGQAWRRLQTAWSGQPPNKIPNPDGAKPKYQI